MTTTSTKSVPDDANRDSSWSSAPKLSRKVRDLAQRSYQALKTYPDLIDQIQAHPQAAPEELRDLRDQVARLQQKIHDRRLHALIPWVDALMQQVNARLHRAGEDEK